MTTTASEWTILALSDETRARAHLGDHPWPIRRAALDDTLHPRVQLLRLLEEADRWCAEHSDGGKDLAHDIPRLAWITAVDALDDHHWEGAVHACDIGLRYSPRNISLWSHLALARHGQRDTESAVAAFTQAILECSRVGFFAPMLWILGARAFDDAGLAGTALGLLEDVARFVPPDEAFWELLADVRVRAASQGS